MGIPSGAGKGSGEPLCIGYAIRRVTPLRHPYRSPVRRGLYGARRRARHRKTQSGGLPSATVTPLSHPSLAHACARGKNFRTQNTNGGGHRGRVRVKGEGGRDLPPLRQLGTHELAKQQARRPGLQDAAPPP